MTESTLRLPLKIKNGLRNFSWPQFLTLVIFLLFFTVILVLPLLALFSKAFVDRSGNFIGLANYREYFSSPTLSIAVLHTLDISFFSTVISVICGFLYAFALTRTAIKNKTFFKYIALIPIFIPTIVHALTLVYTIGRQGILTRWGLQVELYGRLGIIISEIIYTFPQAFLMFYVALDFADGRLYEAAEAMGISAWRRLWKITLPEIKYTVINVFFICFTLVFTDFGAPKVIGGSYSVLATDVYKQVAGQFNMNMGAVVGTLLLLPAILSFIVDRFVNSKNNGTINARATKLVIKKNKTRDLFFAFYCWLITGIFIFLIVSLIIGAFSEYYPYNLALTLKNFRFNESAGGMNSYFNSLKMSLLTAIFGTVFVFIYAYLMEKLAGLSYLRKYGQLLSLLPMALPGMVIGLAFIFFFNALNNPLNFLYGTIGILVISNILHYFSVPFMTATGCLKKLDKEYESIGESMNIPQRKTFMRVSVPLSLPGILEIFMYYFVNSMVTVSAVVFLYSAKFKIGSIAITHMEEAGNISQAAAMSLLILLINVVVRILYEIAIKIITNNVNKREIINE